MNDFNFNPDTLTKNRILRWLYCGEELLCSFLLPIFLFYVLPYDVIPKYLGFDMPLVSLAIIICIVLAIGCVVDKQISNRVR